MEYVYEVSYQDIRREVDKRTKERSLRGVGNVLGMPITVRLESLDPQTGVFEFSSSSGTNPNKRWHQKIRLKDLDLAFLIPENLSILDRARIAMEGDIEVTCDCPAFRYWGGAYIMTQKDAKYGVKENRFPKIRNPHLEGSVCKHLDAVLRAFPFYASTLASRRK